MIQRTIIKVIIILMIIMIIIITIIIIIIKLKGSEDKFLNKFPIPEISLS